MTPEAIIEALDGPHKTVPTDLLHAATEQQAALTEPLLASLAQWVDKTVSSDAAWDDQASMLPDFALYLLAQFREPRAYPLYLRLCRLPEDLSDYWLGDILLGNMPAFLASTCAGDLEPLKALVMDASVNEWARWAALNALNTVAIQGEVEADAIAEWLLQLAEHQARDAGNLFWTMLAGTQYDLALPALMPVLRQAYADRLVDSQHVSLAELELAVEDATTHRLSRSTSHNDYLRDAGRAMEWLIEARNRPDDEDSFSPDEVFGDEFDYPAPDTYVRPAPKIGRNDPCPCGSGRKHKKCCLNADPFAEA